MFIDLWHRLTNWFRRRTAVLPQPTKAIMPPAEAALPKPITKPTEEDAIRFYEKRRMKHDKFVKPQGELPARQPSPHPVTQELTPRLPKPDIEPAIEPQSCMDTTGLGMYAVERHHEDGEKVLFKVEEAIGEFNFRDTILQQLDSYFFYLKRMKKHAPDAYGMYRRVGATILPYFATGSWHRSKEKPPEKLRQGPIPPLPAWFNATRPGFGCFAYGADPETERFEQTTKCGANREMWVPKFMYFTKYTAPPFEVQPMSGGDIYMLTIWWDRPSKKNKHGVPQELPIFISKDGKTIKALKVLKSEWIPVPTSRHGRLSIPSRQWQIPKEYREWAKQNEEDVQHFLVSVFVDSITQSENSHMSMTRIAATKGNMTAVFSVNIRRTAYFFQDRDISVTQSGTRKPVFHVVRPHIRKDGAAVKMHFRGVRDFTWAGYSVHISVPGLDHADINQLDIGAADQAMVEDTKGSVTAPQMGKELADHMRRGWAVRV